MLGIRAVRRRDHAQSLDALTRTAQMIQRTTAARCHPSRSGGRASQLQERIGAPARLASPAPCPAPTRYLRGTPVLDRHHRAADSRYIGRSPRRRPRGRRSSSFDSPHRGRQDAAVAAVGEVQGLPAPPSGSSGLDAEWLEGVRVQQHDRNQQAHTADGVGDPVHGPRGVRRPQTRQP
jgi:hypothetical protein